MHNLSLEDKTPFLSLSLTFSVKWWINLAHRKISPGALIPGLYQEIQIQFKILNGLLPHGEISLGALILRLYQEIQIQSKI